MILIINLLMGYVYLLMSTDSDGETELFKIGITKGSIENRIKSLSTGNPNKIVHLKTFESVHYKMIEKWLHSKYSINRTESKNEWFSLPNEDVRLFEEICKGVEENIKMLQNSNHFFGRKI